MDEFSDPDEMSTSPGPWFLAGFYSECVYGDAIFPDDTIRATGDGDYEHKDCAEYEECASTVTEFVREDRKNKRNGYS